MRWLLLFSLLFPACRCADEAPAPAEVTAPRPAPPSNPWRVAPPELAEDGTIVRVRITAPADAPEHVWAGLVAVRPDGEVADFAPKEVRPADLEDVSLAIPPGVTAYAVGVWDEPPCADCDPVAALGTALVAWPPRAEGMPRLDKPERRIRVRFADVGTGGPLAKAVRQTTATRLAFHYPGPTWSVATEDATDPGDPRDAVLVRHRDPVDAEAAQTIARDLRRTLRGTEVVVEHAPDLPVPFVVDLGGEVEVAPGAEVGSEPTRMRRPGR